MGKLAWKPGDRVYLDTNLFIYAVEAIDPYAEEVSHLFQAADRVEIILVASLLALAEALVMPFRKRDDLLVGAYRDLLILHTPPSPRGLSRIPKYFLTYPCDSVTGRQGI